MTNYIITETQLADVRTLVHWLCFGECRTTDRAIPTSASVARMLESLKPIEPLSDEDIDRMWYEATAGRMHIKLARAIERHIIGETP